MKKIVIPVLAFLLALIGFVVYAVSFNFRMVQYEKDLTKHMMSLEDGQLIAEYNGQTTSVSAGNLGRIQKVLNVSEKKVIRKLPEYDETCAVFLEFPDGAKYIVAENADIEDGVFILYTYNRKHQYFTVDGYNSFSWIIRAVSPEGISSENEIIE